VEVTVGERRNYFWFVSRVNALRMIIIFALVRVYGFIELLFNMARRDNILVQLLLWRHSVVVITRDFEMNILVTQVRTLVVPSNPQMKFVFD
jgi:hypothetical protein